MVSNMERGLSPANFITAQNCRLFPNSALEPVIDFGWAPLANSLRESSDATAPAAPLILKFSERAKCGQLSVTVDPAQLFSQYVWVTGTSATATAYSKLFCKQMLEAKPDAKKVVEIASNDGTFLLPFKERELQVLGIDPAENIALKAKQVGIPTEVLFFDKKSAESLLSRYGKFDLIYARNVLPHVPDPREIIEGIAGLLSPTGVGAIEFHSSKTILEELHYDSIYHEHIYYLTLTTVSDLLHSYELKPFDLFRSPISGGSLVLLFSLESRTPSESLKDELASEESSDVLKLSGWKRFGEAVAKHQSIFKNLIQSEKNEGRKLVGYGASARSMTLLHATDTARLLNSIVDNNPLKQGLYSSTGAIPILSGEEAFATNPDTIVLLAWNFTTEIMKLLKERHNFSGNVIVPLPGAPFLDTSLYK